MSSMPNLQPRPEILISDKTCEELNRLADASLKRAPRIAELLLGELERAEIVAVNELPQSVVDLGSWVMFKEGEVGETQLIRLVYPHEADIASRKISVLTPVGTALLGLSEGQSIDYVTTDGRLRRLTVLRVLDGPGSSIVGKAADP